MDDKFLEQRSENGNLLVSTEQGKSYKGASGVVSSQLQENKGLMFGLVQIGTFCFPKGTTVVFLRVDADMIEDKLYVVKELKIKFSNKH